MFRLSPLCLSVRKSSRKLWKIALRSSSARLAAVPFLTLRRYAFLHIFFSRFHVVMSLYSVMYSSAVWIMRKQRKKATSLTLVLRYSGKKRNVCDIFYAFLILYYLLLSKDSVWVRAYSTDSYTSTFTNYHHYCAKVFYID